MRFGRKEESIPVEVRTPQRIRILKPQKELRREKEMGHRTGSRVEQLRWKFYIGLELAKSLRGPVKGSGRTTVMRDQNNVIW